MTTGFHPLTVAEIRRETDDAVSLLLRPAEDTAARFAFAPGQHLTLRTEIDGEELRRSYSVCAAPHEGELRVAIKRLDGGRFSSWIHRDVAAGDVIEAMPPHGRFTYAFDPGRAATYVALAAGSGITPILSLLKTALATEPESRFVLLYGNRSSVSVMFLEELAALKNRFMSRLQVYHFLSDEEEDVDLFNGRLDAAKVADILARLVDPGAIAAAFVCGPGAMMDAVEAGLATAGVPASRILSERFGVDRPAGTDETARAASAKAEGLRMSVAIDGRRRSVVFDAAAGNILDSARAAGLPAPFACKAGVCATCRAKLVRGEVRMLVNYGLSPDEVAAGYILTCQAIPESDNVAVDYDA